MGEVTPQAINARAWLQSKLHNPSTWIALILLAAGVVLIAVGASTPGDVWLTVGGVACVLFGGAVWWQFG